MDKRTKNNMYMHWVSGFYFHLIKSDTTQELLLYLLACKHLLFDQNNLCFDQTDLWFRSYELAIEGTFRGFIKFYLWKKVRTEDENSQANWWLTLVLSRSICLLPGPVNLPVAQPLMNLLNLRSNWLDTNDNAQLSILIVSWHFFWM